MTDRELLRKAFKYLKDISSFYGGHRSDKMDQLMMAIEIKLAEPDQEDILRVADAVELSVATKADRLFAANELRRLHDENETLKKCLLQMQNAAIELAKPEQEECVCCGDYERCLKPCTPRGRWQGKQDAAAQPERKLTEEGDAWGEMAKKMSRDFVERANKNWEPPPKGVDTITMAELRQTDLYRKVQTQLLRDIFRGDNT